MTAAARDSKPALDRGRVWQLRGAPADQVGSVNDPRSCREHGALWNEKWIYLAHDPDRHGEVVRIVLWYRYDLAGVFRVKPDGSVEPESLAGDGGEAH